MLELVGGDDSFSCTGETLEDEGEDGGLDGAPGGGRVRVSSPGLATFVNEGESGHHFGEALGVLEEADDKVGGRVGMPGSDEINGSGREIIQRQGRTVLDRPGGSRLWKEAAV